MNEHDGHSKAITIVVPVFDEEQTVRAVIDRIRILYAHAEIIVVDDGSRDGSARMLAGAPVRVLRHTHNRGYGAAIKTGIVAATHDIIVTIDADGEHVPEDIEGLVNALPGVDMVVGMREMGTRDPGFVKRVGRFIFNRTVCFLASTRIPDINSGLRVFRKSYILRFVDLFPNTFSFHTTSSLAVLFSGGLVKYIPVRLCSRVGISKVKLQDGLISLAFVMRLSARLEPRRWWAGFLSVVVWILCGILSTTPWGCMVIMGGGGIILGLDLLSRNENITARILQEPRLG